MMLDGIAAMESLWRYVACLLLAAGLASGAEPADRQPGEVLLRDSFEEGDRRPEKWRQGRDVAGVQYVWDERQASDGQRSLGLLKRARRYFPIAQWTRTLPCDRPGSTLRVAVNVKAERMTKAVVDARFLNDRGEPISHEWIAYIGAKEAGDPPADHDWKEYSGNVVIPAATRSIALGLQIYGPGRVWFDELEVRLLDAGARARENSREAPSNGSSDGAIQVAVRGRATGRYLIVGPDDGQEPPQKGYALLVVLPGGAGTADFHPFVRRIREHALDDSFLVAQPLAVEWTSRQALVWPTKSHRAPRMKYTTEDLVESVIEDVSGRHPVDSDRVYMLGWSSAGPAAYATLLQEDAPVHGGLIAMSVFKPSQLPPLRNAQGRGFYLLHSPDDRVCPFRMAQTANEALQAAGARTKLARYPGGHGWRGDVFGNIRRGVEWLESHSSDDAAAP